MNGFYRLLFTILFIGGVGAASLWIIGGQTDRYSTEIEIDAPPKTVFDWLVDGEKIRQWVTGVSDVANFTDPEISVGDRDTTTPRTVTVEGETIKLEDRIMRFDSGKTFSVQSTNDNLIQTSIFQLDATADGNTKLSYRIHLQKAGVGRMMAAFDKSNVDDRMIAEVKKLKQLVESAAPVPEPPKEESDFEALFGP